MKNGERIGGGGFTETGIQYLVIHIVVVVGDGDVVTFSYRLAETARSIALHKSCAFFKLTFLFFFISFH